MSQQWIIGHPGTGAPIECSSFEEAMEKWFEGFNLPRLYTDGAAEDFTTAYKRVQAHLNSDFRSLVNSRS